jgi:cell division transport system ATP-binding protein
VLRLLGLEKKSTFRARWLSGGEKQKLCVGRALVHRPKLVLADEPTGNLDAASALEVLNLLWNLSRNDCVTVIVATHNEALLERFPARAILLEQGRIRGERF